jgi:hypothetical protein
LTDGERNNTSINQQDIISTTMKRDVSENCLITEKITRQNVGDINPSASRYKGPLDGPNTTLPLTHQFNIIEKETINQPQDPTPVHISIAQYSKEATGHRSSSLKRNQYVRAEKRLEEMDILVDTSKPTIEHQNEKQTERGALQGNSTIRAIVEPNQVDIHKWNNHNKHLEGSRLVSTAEEEKDEEIPSHEVGVKEAQSRTRKDLDKRGSLALDSDEEEPISKSNSNYVRETKKNNTIRHRERLALVHFRSLQSASIFHSSQGRCSSCE